MARETETSVVEMERAAIAGTSLEVSRVAIGTWAIGGWMWGGTDEAESIATIRAAVEHGINLIDTAPVYGFGPRKKSSARPSPRVISARACSSRPRPELSGPAEECSAMPAARASSRKLRIHCAGFEPITLTSTKFTGQTRW